MTDLFALFAPWAVAVAVAVVGAIACGIQREHTRRARTRATAAERLAADRLDRVREARQDAADAGDVARQWMAEADRLAADLERHAARCPWAAADPEIARSN